MHNREQRLLRCFTTVFPDLAAEQAAEASQDSVAAWDSVATLNLITLLDEEFGLQVDYDQIENLTSFRTILQYVEENAPR